MLRTVTVSDLSDLVIARFLLRSQALTDRGKPLDIVICSHCLKTLKSQKEMLPTNGNVNIFHESTVFCE